MTVERRPGGARELFWRLDRVAPMRVGVRARVLGDLADSPKSERRKESLPS